MPYVHHARHNARGQHGSHTTYPSQSTDRSFAVFRDICVVEDIRKTENHVSSSSGCFVVEQFFAAMDLKSASLVGLKIARRITSV